MTGLLKRAWSSVTSGGNIQKLVAGGIALALLAYVFQIANHANLWSQLWQVVVRVGWMSLLIAIGYFILRALTWHWLTRQLHLAIPWRQLTVAFAAGELAKSLPGGIYLQSYVLAKLRDFDERRVVDSTMATTGMDVHQGIISFIAVMVIGLPGNAWFRYLVLGVAGIWVGIIVIGWLVEKAAHPGDDRSDPRWIRHARRIGQEVVRSSKELMTPSAWKPFLATIVYTGLYVGNFYLVLTALGIGKVGIVGAIVVISITNLGNEMVPIPLELGMTEATGYGALQAFGLGRAAAATAMLGYRVVTTGSLMIITGLVLLIFHRELQEAAEGGSGHRRSREPARGHGRSREPAPDHGKGAHRGARSE